MSNIQGQYQIAGKRIFQSLIFVVAVLLSSGTLNAQQIPTVEQIKWKSEAQIREMLGEPQSTQGPIGTHATYSLWQYPDFTVAFSNQRAIHVFDKDSLKVESPSESDQP